MNIFRKKFVSNILIVGSYNYLSVLVTFLSSTIISRLLSPKEYGFVALITVFSGFITMFSDAGLSYAIIRSRYSELFSKVMHFLAILIGFILFSIMVLFAYPISIFYNTLDLFWPIIILSTTFIIKSLVIIPQSLLNKNLEFSFLGKINLISTIVNVLTVIILAFLEFSYWSLIIAQITSSLSQWMFIKKRESIDLHGLRKKYIYVAIARIKSLLLNISGFNIINYWARNADNLIVGKVYGKEDLGIYSRAYLMLSMPLSLVTNIFNQVLFPTFKSSNYTNVEIKSEYLRLLGVLSFVCLPFTLVLTIWPDEIVLILWGTTWFKVSELIGIFGTLLITQTLISTTGHMFILYNKERLLFINGTLNSLVMVIFIFWGAVYSIKHVVLFYALSYLLFVVPLVIYQGFIKAFDYKIKEIVLFWSPKILFSLTIIFCIYFKLIAIKNIILALYVLYLFVAEKKIIVALINSINDILKSKHNLLLKKDYNNV